jgi:dinuclear metal center YbgI/SA1388 family protein
MKRKKLENFFEKYWGKEFLEKWQKKDTYGANGLQIKGSNEVKKVALGVSLNQDFLKHAFHWGADTCVFHHALSLIFPQHMVSAHSQGRLKIIFENNLNIFGFHGVMDAHPKYGHNVLTLKKLGVKILGNIGDDWGWYGDLPQKVKLTKIGEACHQLFKHEVFVVGKPDQMVKRVAMFSGGGVPTREELLDMIQKGIELYISGEIREFNPHIFSENKVCYFSGGHYATEKIGLFELEKNLKKEFPSLKIKFIDIPNPL